MTINNETIGISAEVAIAKSFNITVNPEYALRANKNIIDLLDSKKIIQIFQKENIPCPIKHIAESQNPVDFLLSEKKTLSIKTNKNNIGKAAPQIIGQPTSNTYFEYIEKYNIIPNFNLRNFLISRNLEDNYYNRGQVFKELSIKYIDILIDIYWKNIFDCDYLILFFNLDTFQNPLFNYKIWGKIIKSPFSDKKKFQFTRYLDKWNESTTLKYSNISIGEFQVHKNRDCFKFRFNMKGISELIEKNII